MLFEERNCEKIKLAKIDEDYILHIFFNIMLKEKFCKFVLFSEYWKKNKENNKMKINKRKRNGNYK